MKKEIQEIYDDIERFEKSSVNIKDYNLIYKNTFYELKGKYGHLDSFPVLMDNPLFLQNHSDVYKNYCIVLLIFNLSIAKSTE